MLVNKLISLLGAVLSGMLSVLPSSPFSWDLSGIDNNFMKLIFWLIPVQEIATVLSTYLIAVGVYYAIRVVLRWVRVAGD